MKSYILKYYGIFLFFYTLFLLFLLFFAFGRGDVKHQHYSIHPIPFESMENIALHFAPMAKVANLLGNVLLFVPYGFVGIVYPAFRNAWRLLIVFFIIINIVEFLQYFTNRGYADVDDVILNTSGTMIGYIFYKKYFL